MSSNGKLTYFWEDIFPDSDTWKTFSGQIVDLTDTSINVFDTWCYKILSRFFHGTNIRYTNQQDFTNMLATVYENKFNMFKREKELIDISYALTETELQTVSQAISNQALNPNTEPVSVLEPINYVSAQTFSTLKNNKLNAYLTAINNMKSLQIIKFLRGDSQEKNDITFVDLFMTVIPNTEYFYKV